MNNIWELPLEHRDGGGVSVCLYYESPTLILPIMNTGVWYYNQTNCVSCTQRDVEGIMIPHNHALTELLYNGFCLHNYNQRSGTKEFEDMLNRLVRHKGWSLTHYDFEEGWTTLYCHQGSEYVRGQDFEVILTWENCD